MRGIEEEVFMDFPELYHGPDSGGMVL